MAPIWHELAGHHRRWGLVIILSDFFDQIDALIRALQHLRHRHHEVVLFQVVAPEELEFPFRGMTQFRNLEKEDDRLLVDARRMGEEYLESFNAFREQLPTCRYDAY